MIVYVMYVKWICVCDPRFFANVQDLRLSLRGVVLIGFLQILEMSKDKGPVHWRCVCLQWIMMYCELRKRVRNTFMRCSIFCSQCQALRNTFSIPTSNWHCLRENELNNPLGCGTNSGWQKTTDHLHKTLQFDTKEEYERILIRKRKENTEIRS